MMMAKILLLLCRLSAAWLMTTVSTCMIQSIGVQAFAATNGMRSTRRRGDRKSLFPHSVPILILKSDDQAEKAAPTTASLPLPRAAAALFSGKGDDYNGGDDDDEREKKEGEDAGIANAAMKRIERADFLEIRRDAILVACFVLCRYFVYDVTTGEKLVPGFTVQDAIYLTGTLSSAAVLGLYWTAAGLLTRMFEGGSSSSSSLANAVTIAMCCPLWIATEHLLGFGPEDIGGPTLDASVANGFVGLASFMAVTKILTRDWR